jgi:hypothetical protein
VGVVNELDAWIEAASAELGLAPGDVMAKEVLDVARDVAHQVLRPGAPVSAYLMGVAVGRGAEPSDVAARLSALALAWPARREEAAPARESARGEEVAPASGSARGEEVAPASGSARRGNAAPAVEAEEPGEPPLNAGAELDDPPLP